MNPAVVDTLAMGAGFISDTHRLNVADPNFPYVGIIGRTDFESPATCAGHRMICLSKYLPEDERPYQMTPRETLGFSMPHVQRMSPDLDPAWITDFHVWKARSSRPIPLKETPLDGLFPSTTCSGLPRGPRRELHDLGGQGRDAEARRLSGRADGRARGLRGVETP